MWKASQEHHLNPNDLTNLVLQPCPNPMVSCTLSLIRALKLTLLAYEILQQLVPSDASFELKPSPGKGWGVFATANIQKGSVILQEKPLFVIYKPYDNITEIDIHNSFNNLTSHEKALFLSLRNNSSTEFTSMRAAFEQNSFDFYSDRGISFGLLLLASRFNHSCVPNAIAPTSTEEQTTLIARHNIYVGDEITFCYDSDLAMQTRQERRRTLNFRCRCTVCVPVTPHDQLSDLRRQFVRGLQYLNMGEDFDGKKIYDLGSSSLLLDPTLKKAAEQCTISISRRWIMNILALYLLEEEGLLDQSNSNIDGVVRVAQYFKTKSNVRIAKLVLEKRTWAEKLWVAFRLLGKSDENDSYFAALMRIGCGLSSEVGFITV